MKKLICKFALLAILLVLMNWIYGKFFHKNDLLKHSDEIELVWKVVKDSCTVVYAGESSNITYLHSDKDKRKISDFVFDYFPDMKCGDMTKSAAHSEVYYHLFNNIPENSSVETVIITMNLRSFGYNWIESNLETPIQKYLVLLKKYPPLFNRFKLAFKAYDIKSDSERAEARLYHKKNDKIIFPYSFKYDNTADWDLGKAVQGVIDSKGKHNKNLTRLACHYIKGYAFMINDDNPRIKNFDEIVELARQRGWNLIFNLMDENVDRANELVGKDLLYLIRYNRDYLINRYGNIENVTIVDNLGELRNSLFIDQNWTTEHYSEAGRRTIANNVAQAVKKYHPDMYVECDEIEYPKNYYRKNDSISVSNSNPYGLIIKGNTSDVESNVEKVYISARVFMEECPDDASIVIKTFKDGAEVYNKSIKINKLCGKNGKWEFVNTVFPIDQSFFDADTFQIYLCNHSATAIHIKSMDASFEYDDFAWNYISKQ